MFHFHYIVSLKIKAVRAQNKDTPKKSPALGSQVHFHVLGTARTWHCPAPPLRFQKHHPHPFPMLRLFASSDIFLASAEILTHKSHLSNDIVKQASKCQHMALQSGDQRGEWGTPRWRLSSASSHLQVIWNRFPMQRGYLARQHTHTQQRERASVIRTC